MKTGNTSGEYVKGDPETAPTDGALRVRALAPLRCAAQPAASTGQEAGDRQRLVRGEPPACLRKSQCLFEIILIKL